jgi:hypothetical protein
MADMFSTGCLAGIAEQVCSLFGRKPVIVTQQNLDTAVKIYKYVSKIINKKVEEDNQASGAAPISSGKEVHMIIVALDYPGTGNELTCTKDGDNLQVLTEACGVTDMTILYNNEGNYANVENAIKDVGSRCNDGDFFVFYYSGHGTSVEDKNGDEQDGSDEAFCLVTPEGKLDWSKFMIDDDFSRLVTKWVSDDVHIIVLSDCCHSGTICDFGSKVWEGKRGISISGCTDSQTSGDTGKGGIFTHSMLMAIEGLKRSGDDDYSCGKLFNKTLDKDNSVFKSKQDLTIAHTPSIKPNQMAWPLIPQGSYEAPWGK